ncbi:MAG TPA: CPBP family glutamic-type intramembrane protease [Verrucomicrobiales bacterium]|nr:CPBP family glutamic-type intramembrane protease [Verrucomicrobiales bacterium]
MARLSKPGPFVPYKIGKLASSWLTRAIRSFPWKTALVLWLSASLTTPLLVPYLFGLFEKAPNAPVLPDGVGWVLARRLTIRHGMILLIPAFVGLWLARRVGWGAPYLECALDRAAKPGMAFGQVARRAAVAGIWVAAVLFALEAMFYYGLNVTAPAPEVHARIGVAAWRGGLATLRAALAEEVFCRLFLQSLLAVVLLTLLRIRNAGPAREAMLWLATAGGAFVFAWLHLSNQEVYAATVPPLVYLRTMLLTGTAGILLGRVFWKGGLEAAILAHAVAGGILQVLRPLGEAVWAGMFR